MSRSENIIVPVNLPFRPAPQLFVLNSGVWQSHDDEIEIVEENEPEVEFEENDSEISTSESQLFDPLFPAAFQMSPESDAVNSEKIDGNTPLPEFSDLIRTHLQENNLSAVWGKFIEECAKYYYGKFPNIHNSSEYQAIGKKMYQMHPAIECEGKEPWSFFCKSLSQKIRHIKWRNKRKKLPHSPRQVRPKIVKKRKVVHSSLKVKPVNRDSDTKNLGKLYKALVRELKHDWDRNSCSEERIKSILRQTFRSRRYWILSSTTGKLSTVIKEFPCFTAGKYVVYDFLLIINKEDTSELIKRMETLFTVVGGMMNPVVTPEGNVNAIKILQYMEEQTGLFKGKGVIPKSVLVHKVNVPGDETMLHLRTDENTSPHLLIFTAGDNIIDAYIVGDNQVIKTDANTLFDALIVLIATYYTFNLEYPKVFSQVLGLFQTYVIGENYTGIKSNMCTLFLKKLGENVSSE